MLLNNELIKKYDKAVPRYTSYPAYPYWNKSLTFDTWIQSIRFALEQKSSKQFSVYIHLPYCESLCYFCGCNKIITKNHDLELNYLSAILKEWRIYKMHLPQQIELKEMHFGGGTPTFFSPKNLHWFLNEFFKDLHISNEHDFSIEAHPGVTNKEHLDMLRYFGFNRLSLGVQDFNEKVQEFAGRYQKVSDVEFCTNYARKISFESINFDMIYGLPFQTEQTIFSTFNTLLEFNPDRIAYYSYAHLPNSKPSQKKLDIPERPIAEDKYALFKKGREILIKNNYKELGFDHFALKSDSLYKAFEQNTLHRNFMGYTVQNTPVLIGLGVSSIGDSSLAYAQNKKSIHQYLQSLHEDFIEFEAGYQLNNEDLIIRQHILNLSCFRKTSLKNGFISNEFNHQILKQIKELQTDGLVQVNNDDEIIVNDLGVPLMRNICVLFDRYFMQGSKVTHSQSV